MKVRVRVAALLHSYTGGRDVIEAETPAADAATLGAVMDDIDRRHPGFAFRVIDEMGRVRRHMNVYVGEESARDRASPIPAGTEVFIVGALSGG
ncbi:MAG: MoaD/ThiS family protein [Planctomycetes bacterium]|nr:MoaD/ThiS family protein [Planctomycetota bacterium]